MAKMKTEFTLEQMDGLKTFDHGYMRIVGKAPENKPYVSIEIESLEYHFIKDKDLELFAVNILKAIKSKRLKP